MSWMKCNSPGWASFDLKQRQKQGLDNEVDKDKDPFPPLTTAIPSLQPCENVHSRNNFSETSFSSALLPPPDFPTLLDNGRRKFSTIGNSSKKNGGVLSNNNHFSIVKKLKELHAWADKRLIEDVLQNSNNNVDEASAFLKAMVSSDAFEENNNEDVPRVGFSEVSAWEQMTEKNLQSATTMEVAILANLENSHGVGYIKPINDVDMTCHSSTATAKPSLGSLKCAPTEPEWEEDDMYLSHRKSALAMMRSASRHSRAATNAFIRGDHISAHQHSMKSQEEWFEAKRLNDKAAKEILAIRNSKNDTWKLDLHGLHAGEAVQALQEHLEKIEIPEQFNLSVSPIKDFMNENLSSSLQPLSCVDGEKYKKRSSTRKIAASLEVITGMGNHSRGEAALPKTVSSFLSENGYRFEELRPGVITVRPKFRM